MADKYFGLGGDDISNSGDSAGDQYLTMSAAIAGSTAGDTIFLTDGALPAPSNRHDLNDERTLKAVNWRAGILQANSGYSDRILDTDGSLLGSEDIYLYGLTLDGEDRVADCLVIERSGSSSLVDVYIDTVAFQDWTNEAIDYNTMGGRLELVGCTFSSSGASAGVLEKVEGPGSGIGYEGAAVVKINHCDITLDGRTSSATDIIFLAGHDTVTHAKQVNIQDVTIDLTNTATTASSMVVVEGIDDVVVEGVTGTLTAANSTADCFGIAVSADGYSNGTADNALILRNKVFFNTPSGFAIQFGNSTADSRMAGGRFSGNYVKGQYYASDSPHGYALGQDTTAEMVSNVAEDFFVNYLISKVNGTTEVSGNLSVNCYGSSYYIKGAYPAGSTGAVPVVSNNVAVVDSATEIRTLGVITVTSQFGVATGGVTIEDNLVIVEDVTKMLANGAHLARQDTGQTATWRRNTYIIPDTVSASEDLFYDGDTYGGACNFAEWSGLHTDERLIQLPQAEVSALVNAYKLQADAASGEAGGAGCGSLGIGI